MSNVRDAEPATLISKLSEELKKGVKQPIWSRYVKSGVSRERAPDSPDWWFIRSASVMRKIYLDGPVGVERLRVYYGGRKNRGHKPERFMKGSGAVIRNIVQQLEQLGYIKKDKKGRAITIKGQSLLDKLAR